jgi:hypothetical protein
MTQARRAQLILQKETAIRTAPTPAAAKVIPFTTFGLARDPRRQQNGTISTLPLPNKSDKGDPTAAGPFTAILDLRSVGNWLQLLLGAPTTTGTTLKTHTFPVNLSDRPSALIERQELDIGKYYRWVGCKLNKLSWDLINNDQTISGELIAAAEVDPVPTAAWDADPTVYAYARACAGGGKITDGAGTTLGTVVGGTIAFDNQMTGYTCADGLEGYGVIDQGDLLISGTLRTVFDGAQAYQLARDGTSTRLKLESSVLVGADKFELIVDIPYAELAERLPPREGKSGLFADLNWNAHNGASQPTITLSNDVTGY